MTKDEKNKIALFKFSVISPLVSNPDHYKSNDAFLLSKVERPGNYLMVKKSLSLLEHLKDGITRI